MIPGLILLGTYVVLAFGQPPLFRIDRAGAAVIGAILMVTVGGLSVDGGARSIDHRTLVLLFGMMVLVAHLELAGFFSIVARAVAGRVAGARGLVACVVIAAGVLSALFVNDPVCLVLTPVVIEICALRSLPALPFLLALATVQAAACRRVESGARADLAAARAEGAAHQAARRGRAHAGRKPRASAASH
jgi:Na+/H+ antiporter NhaD/arsenite permease-like protein